MRDVIIEGRWADVDGVGSGQIRIADGVIVERGGRLGPPTHVFGEDCLLFAGMGDIHIHAREDVSQCEVHKETFASAARAALHGGVVHVADMPNNPVAPVDDESYTQKEQLVKAVRSAVHFTLYAGIGPGTRPLRRTVPYKVYMGPSVGDLFFTRIEQLDQVLAAYRGCAVSFHCEDPDLLELHKGSATHETRRPAICEVVATQGALELIRKHSLVGKLCHCSAGAGLPLLRRAKAAGVPVTAEVTPHHLFFDTDAITDANRPFLQMNPPLRAGSDREAMLQALRDGTLDYLATDHAPHTIDEKMKGVSGQPHLDTYGGFVTWLLIEAGLAPTRIAEVCCANPGAFVEPYSPIRFGRLQPGYAGSLTVLNLRSPWKVERSQLQTRCGWSPFEGVTFPGRVEAVFLSGRNPFE